MSGAKVRLVTNYFRLKQAPDWQLYQYHVAFSPEVESRGLRMRFVKDHREMLGPTRAFDGMVLFLAKRLPNDVSSSVCLRTPAPLCINL